MSTWGESDDQELYAHVERGLERLRREFADKTTAEHVTSIGNDCFEKLIQDAKIVEFIPLLVYRATREALLDSQPDEFAAQAHDERLGTSPERSSAPHPVAMVS